MPATVDAAVAPGAAAAGGAGGGEVTSASSDEQILGISDGGPDAVAAPAADAGAADGAAAAAVVPAPGAAQTPEQIAAAETAQNTVGTLDLRRVPEKYRELAKQDEALRNLLSQELAFRDAGLKAEDVKALREALPEGVKSVEQFKARIAQADKTDEDFLSKDPARQEAVAAGMYDSNPEAFASQFRAATRMWNQRDPQGYTAAVTEILGATLKGAGFTDFGSAARAALLDKTDAGATARAELLGQVIEWLGDFGIGLTREQSVAAREAALAERGQADLATQTKAEVGKWDEFRSGAVADAITAIDAAIAETLTTALPKEYPAAMRERAAAELAREVQKTLNGDRSIQDRVGQLYALTIPEAYNPKTHKGGPIGLRLLPETRKQITEYLSGQGKTLVNTVWARIGGDWISNFAASANEKTARAAAAGAKQDVSSGAAPGTRPPNKLQPKDVNYSKTSDEQILEM